MSDTAAPPQGLTDAEAMRFDDLERRSKVGLTDAEVGEYEALKPRAYGGAAPSPTSAAPPGDPVARLNALGLKPPPSGMMGGGGMGFVHAADRALQRDSALYSSAADIAKAVGENLSKPQQELADARDPMAALRGVGHAALGLASLPITPSLTLNREVVDREQRAARGLEPPAEPWQRPAERLSSYLTGVPAFNLYGRKVVQPFDEMVKEEDRLRPWLSGEELQGSATRRGLAGLGGFGAEVGPLAAAAGAHEVGGRFMDPAARASGMAERLAYAADPEKLPTGTPSAPALENRSGDQLQELASQKNAVPTNAQVQTRASGLTPGPNPEIGAPAPLAAGAPGRLPPSPVIGGAELNPAQPVLDLSRAPGVRPSLTTPAQPGVSLESGPLVRSIVDPTGKIPTAPTATEGSPPVGPRTRVVDPIAEQARLKYLAASERATEKRAREGKPELPRRGPQATLQEQTPQRVAFFKKPKGVSTETTTEATPGAGGATDIHERMPKPPEGPVVREMPPQDGRTPYEAATQAGEEARFRAEDEYLRELYNDRVPGDVAHRAWRDAFSSSLDTRGGRADLYPDWTDVPDRVPNELSTPRLLGHDPQSPEYENAAEAPTSPTAPPPPLDKKARVERGRPFRNYARVPQPLETPVTHRDSQGAPLPEEGPVRGPGKGRADLEMEQRAERVRAALDQAMGDSPLLRAALDGDREAGKKFLRKIAGMGRDAVEEVVRHVRRGAPDATVDDLFFALTGDTPRTYMANDAEVRSSPKPPAPPRPVARGNRLPGPGGEEPPPPAQAPAPAPPPPEPPAPSSAQNPETSGAVSGSPLAPEAPTNQLRKGTGKPKRVREETTPNGVKIRYYSNGHQLIRGINGWFEKDAEGNRTGPLYASAREAEAGLRKHASWSAPEAAPSVSSAKQEAPPTPETPTPPPKITTAAERFPEPPFPKEAPKPGTIPEDVAFDQERLEGKERYRDMTPEQRQENHGRILRQAESGTAKDRAFARAWLDEHRSAKDAAAPETPAPEPAPPPAEPAKPVETPVPAAENARGAGPIEDPALKSEADRGAAMGRRQFAEQAPDVRDRNVERMRKMAQEESPARSAHAKAWLEEYDKAQAAPGSDAAVSDYWRKRAKAPTTGELFDPGVAAPEPKAPLPVGEDALIERSDELQTGLQDLVNEAARNPKKELLQREYADKLEELRRVDQELVDKHGHEPGDWEPQTPKSFDPYNIASKAKKGRVEVPPPATPPKAKRGKAMKKTSAPPVEEPPSGGGPTPPDESPPESETPKPSDKPYVRTAADLEGEKLVNEYARQIGVPRDYEDADHANWAGKDKQLAAEGDARRRLKKGAVTPEQMRAELDALYQKEEREAEQRREEYRKQAARAEGGGDEPPPKPTKKRFGRRKERGSISVGGPSSFEGVDTPGSELARAAGRGLKAAGEGAKRVGEAAAEAAGEAAAGAAKAPWTYRGTLRNYGQGGDDLYRGTKEVERISQAKENDFLGGEQRAWSQIPFSERRDFAKNLRAIVEGRAEPKSDAQRHYVDWFRTAATKVADFANESGVFIRDEGGPRPVPSGWDKFFPQIVKPDMLAKLMADDPATVAKFVEDHVGAGRDFATEAEAKDALKTYRQAKIRSFHPGTELPRRVHWGDDWVIEDGRKAVRSYGTRAIQNAAEHSVWDFNTPEGEPNGPEGQGKLGDALARIKDEHGMGAAAEAEKTTLRILRRNPQDWGRQGRFWRKFNSVEGAVHAARMYTNPKTVIAQGSQFPLLNAKVGEDVAFPALLRVLKNPAAAYRRGLERGAYRPATQFASTFGFEDTIAGHAGEGASRVSNVLLSPMGLHDAFQRSIAVEAAKGYAPKLTKMLNGSEGQIAEATRSLTGMDLERKLSEFKSGEVSDETMNQLEHELVRQTQGDASTAERIPYAADPKTHMLFRGKNFNLSQMRNTWRVAGDELTHGNVKPAARLVLGAIIAGEGLAAMKDVVAGPDPKRPSYDEVKRKAARGDWKPLLERAANDARQASLGGLGGDIALSMVPTPQGKQTVGDVLKSYLDSWPTGEAAVDTVKLGMREAFHDYRGAKKGARMKDLEDYLARELSGPNALLDMVEMATPSGVRNRMKKYAGRSGYADESRRLRDRKAFLESLSK